MTKQKYYITFARNKSENGNKSKVHNSDIYFVLKTCKTIIWFDSNVDKCFDLLSHNVSVHFI